MSQDGPPTRYDFHDPRPFAPAAWKTLKQWIGDSLHLTQETWQPTLTSPVTIHLDKVEPLDLRDSLSAIPQPACGIHLRLGPAGFPGILAISQRQALGLLADLVGEREPEWPAVRDLTELEQSLLAMLLQQMAHSISLSWPAAEPIPALFDGYIDRPHRTRLFAPDATLLCSHLTFKSRFGEEKALWLMPSDEVEDLIKQHASPTESAAQASVNLEELALELPMSVLVELGRTQLKMSEITALRAGDVIVLDQAINRPLQVLIEDRVKFRGQPGRVGARQALAIESTE
jgi:flagellar motor switch protein FliM